jgi:hypothetical protein
MADIGKRLSTLREMRKKHLIQLRANCSSAEKDKNGSASHSLMGTLRFLAVANYVLDKDVAAFRACLREAADVTKKLFDRYDAAEPISPSYISMMAYKELFSALASGDLVLAGSLAEKMGGRESIEKEYDRPFDTALGYTLKNILAADDVGAKKYLETFELTCQEQDNVDFKGYAVVLRAVLNHDVRMAEAGFVDVIAGHIRQCKVGGMFQDTEDELISLWGVGLANLARMRGLKINASDSLIPSELIA